MSGPLLHRGLSAPAAGLGAAAGNAAYFLLIDHLAGSVDPLTLTVGGMSVALVVLLPLAAPWSAPWGVLGGAVPLGSHRAPGWALALLVVLVSTVLSYLTGAAAVQRLSATVAAGLAYVEPAAATVAAWAVLGERLSAVQIAGGGVVLGGAYLAQRGIGSGPGQGRRGRRDHRDHRDRHQDAASPTPIVGTTVQAEALIP